MKQIEDNFVTFEIANGLNEIGFTEECFGEYQEDFLKNPQLEIYQEVDYSGCYEAHPVVLCTAPTWSQVIDWFRNEKRLEINVFKWGVHCYHKEDNPSGECEVLALPHYIYDIERAFEYTDDWEYQSIEDELKFHTYEEARISAILKAIEIVKNTK